MAPVHSSATTVAGWSATPSTPQRNGTGNSNMVAQQDGNKVEAAEPEFTQVVTNTDEQQQKPYQGTAPAPAGKPSDKHLEESYAIGDHYRLHPNREANAGWFSKLFYLYLDPLIRLGYSRQLDESDVGECNDLDRATHAQETFRELWEAELVVSEEQMRKPDLLRVVKAFQGRNFLKAAALYGVWATTTFTGPVMIQLLVRSFEAEEGESNKLSANMEWTLVALSFILPLIGALAFAHQSRIGMRAAVQIRSALSSTVFRKALAVGSNIHAEASTGKIVNLMSNDAQKMVDFAPFMHAIWASPIQIIVCIALLVNVVGVSALVGLALMMVLFPLNGTVMKKVGMARRELLGHTDSRVKLVNEVLLGMKAIKYYAWEAPFMRRIEEMREKELSVLRRIVYLVAVGFVFVLQATPVLTVMLVFATYSQVGDPMTAATAFTTVSLFSVLRLPFAFLPLSLQQFVQVKISFSRLTAFFVLKELQESPVKREAHGDVPIRIKDGEFWWEQPEDLTMITSSMVGPGRGKGGGRPGAATAQPKPEQKEGQEEKAGGDSPGPRGKGQSAALKGINLSLKKGSLTAVVGRVGSGKSSLISAMLGEVTRTEGEVSVEGRVAYVSQEPWIINGTLQDNVLFGAPLDNEKYTAAIRAAQLVSDLEVLPAGDQTEIGERGINLSGGQKARVSLARAVYSDTDIVLMDDPLSAVDAHVGQSLFDECINAVLKGRTIVMTTNQLQFLKQCDQVVLMEEGAITLVAPYERLRSEIASFEAMMKQFEATSAKKSAREEVENQERKQSVADIQVSPVAGKVVSPAVAKLKGAEEKWKVGEGTSSRLTTVEERNEGQVQGSAYKYFFEMASYFLIFTILGLYMFEQVSRVGNDFWLAYWAEETVSVATPMPQSDVDRYIGIYCAIGIVNVVTNLSRSLVVARARVTASRNIHRNLLERIVRAPPSFFDTTPIGRVINRFSKDMDTVDLTLGPTLIQLFHTLFAVAGSLIGISVSSKGLFIPLLIPVSLTYYFVQKYYRRTSVELQRLDSVSRSPIFAQFSESITGASTLRAYGAVPRFVAMTEEKISQNNNFFIHFQFASNWLSLRLDILGAIVVVFVCSLAVGTDTFPAGAAGLALTYSFEITGALKHASRMMAEAESKMNAVERIQTYTSTISQEAAPIVETNRPSAQWPHRGEITFANLQMRYREETPLVLKGLNAKVRAGERVGIVGRTGAGKSSIMVALFRMVEAAGGSIVIDGIDISTIGLQDLRSRLFLIPQDPTLFTGSLAYNLDPAGTSSEEELKKALRAVHLEQLTEELQLEVQEGGANFSVGERQLICIARALLQNPTILLLDEATASVDTQTDGLIQEALRENFKQSTILTIAHRLNTIMDSDRVLVMSDGVVGEFDSPKNLLKDSNSAFAKMVASANVEQQ